MVMLRKRTTRNLLVGSAGAWVSIDTRAPLLRGHSVIAAGSIGRASGTDASAATNRRRLGVFPRSDAPAGARTPAGAYFERIRP